YTKSHARLPSSTIIGGQEGNTKQREERLTNDGQRIMNDEVMLKTLRVIKTQLKIFHTKGAKEINFASPLYFSYLFTKYE
ncbi:MAG: hypothetical protein KKF20_03945, partial [Bacteroidetes bacterium]|nr:hypothetical protein [Bacteroidota bacterium]